MVEATLRVLHLWSRMRFRIMVSMRLVYSLLELLLEVRLRFGYNAHLNIEYFLVFFLTAMMTNVMAGSYPELFAAASAYSGVPFGCFAGASDWNSQCSAGELIKTAAQWARIINLFTWTTSTRTNASLIPGRRSTSCLSWIHRFSSKDDALARYRVCFYLSCVIKKTIA
jgi:hypothetical protein